MLTLFFTVLQESHHCVECDITTKGALKAAFYSTSLIIVNIPQMNIYLVYLFWSSSSQTQDTSSMSVLLSASTIVTITLTEYA